MCTEEGGFHFDSQQTAALVAIDAAQQKNILITGPAGTGKTSVLLEALTRPGDDIPEPAEKPRLITFSRTLAKYDGYRAKLIRSEAEYEIITSETFFWRFLVEKEPRHRVDYDILRKLIPDANDSGTLSDGELWIEIEEFLFGMNLSQEEYVDAIVPRQGLKTGLNRQEREKIWKIREALAHEMIRRKVYSKHFSRLQLLGWLEHDINEPPPGGELFVDESQDMAAVELLCLKSLSAGRMILAGDTGQSIYGFINPYRRAGLQLPQEGICLLSTNHRNAVSVHDIAESYRIEGLSEGENPGPESKPYREGSMPEIRIGNNPQALAELLVAHVKYRCTGENSQAESLAVICSRNAHLEQIKVLLNAVGLDALTVRDNSFDFAEPGSVRLSTLHSAKGLEFDSVFMYLPEMPPAREIDAAYQERLFRNLIYVAMTRTREKLEIFATVKSERFLPNLSRC